QRFTTDFGFIREALTRLSTVLVRETLSALALVAVMIWFDWVLTLIAAVVIPVIAYPVNKLGRRLRRVATITQEQTGLMAGMVSESLAGAKVAKTYELEGYLKDKARESFEEIRDLRIKSANAKGRLDPLMEIGAGLAVATAFVFIGVRIVNGHSTIGEFSGFITALLLAAQPVRVLGNLHAALQEAMSAVQRFYATIDELPTILEAPDAKPLHLRGGEVEFDNVHFRYRKDEDNRALEGICFRAEKGRTTALVGHSGSGKSTVLALVARLYDVETGAVRIDGQDIREVTLHSLRQAVAIVTQDVMLFDDTVRANIAFGREGATEEEIIAAAKAAAAHEFICGLQNGYDTRVGVGGGRLSGGERQRVSIARAFLRDAPILLLDEATSALDSESESLVQKALSNLMKDRTTLVVAHRLSTIKNADHILVMERGALLEEGTHQDLLESGGAYAKMYQLQTHGEFL
ncbi:MAG: ABC transporter ATP-binding protein/permease, partial [Methylobacteriaceae bacterium]|nr:ABC transporter ATP-binding protein/permease [Methylobacteriaceae bacterium]